MGFIGTSSPTYRLNVIAYRSNEVSPKPPCHGHPDTRDNPSSNVGFWAGDKSGCRLQRKSAFLKVFRCGPQRNRACHEMAACVDKPRKDEAARVLMRLWGKSSAG